MAGIKGQTAILAVGTALSGSALALSAATVASPVVLTTAANTFANGDIGVVTGLVGPVNLNNRAFQMNPVTSTTATLKGEDGSANAAYVSGGTVQKYTMTAIGNVTAVKGFTGTAAEINITNLQSQAKEFMLGLQDFGEVTVDILLTAADVGQIFIRKIKASATVTPFSLTLSDGSVSAFMAAVKSFSFDGVKPDGAVTGSITLRVTNAPAFFA